MSSFLEARTRARLADLDDRGLRRRLGAPAGIDLASNDYLGLSRHPRIVERLVQAVRDEGCGSTGSRLLRGHRPCFEQVEQRFARFKGTERSLYFSSGYLANLAVLTTLPERGDLIFSDAHNHASLIDGMRLSHARSVVFPHNDVGALAGLMEREPTGGHRFVVTESLFSMGGDVAPLAALAALCRSREASLIVDEAHAVGVYGVSGSGLVEAAAATDDVLASINTAGKALGVSGAFVAGPDWVVDYLIQRARSFIFSTAPPPALAAALETSLDVIATEPERRVRLRTRAAALRTALTRAGVADLAGDTQIIPIILGSNQRAVAVAERLQTSGFDVRAIRPPTVPDHTARLRVSVNVDLSDAAAERFVQVLDASLRAIPCSAVCS